ncbi:DUF7878 domain-containing protein [Metabacillus malikii]|uniref:DUF7878 domain-containing protein n=1 Tax=Metabacillus malikii TaxID=1504265 RepID=A0ABT9ZK09_9BACI|nr:hypothetical protein [Metabacillus malikii]MDQ0232102.1 hypothetical protein [Metabacillus malikii]
MTHFQLLFKLNKDNQIDTREKDGKLLLDIEGKLEVMINNQCFFSESYLALLEFAVALSQWDQKDSFTYYTMEHDEREGPILTFRKHEDNTWSVFSIWQTFEYNGTISSTILHSEVDRFLLAINNELAQTYKLTTKSFR